MNKSLSPILLLDYTNHEGERSVKTVTPIRVWYGKTDRHIHEQWLLEAVDHKHGASRNYALRNIWSWVPETGGKSSLDVSPGVYRHFKGNFYQVLFTACDSESRVDVVVYRTLYGDFSTWVRPKAMFIEMVDIEGSRVRRFEYVGPIA